MNKDRVFIIAEAGVNHNGSILIAKEMIDAAFDAGADAIKLQTYTPDTLTIDCRNKWFKIGGRNQWTGKSWKWRP